MIVVDASVGIKWFKKDEEDEAIARNLFKNHAEKKNEIIIPSLFFLEIANVLAVLATISAEAMKKRLQFLHRSNFAIHSFSKNNLNESAILAKQYKTTVYDMLYAVIAKELQCSLVTADTEFYKKTKFPFITLLHNYKG